jgi:hypothetical protein
MRTRAVMLMVTLTVGLAVPQQAHAVPKRIAEQVKNLDTELRDLQDRYRSRATYYATRAKSADQPAPYEKLFERFTTFAANAGSLRSELKTVRTSKDLSKIRAKKIKLHQSASRALQNLMKETAQNTAA